MGEDPDVIRKDIENTRERMGDTVDALGYKTDVKARAGDKVTSLKEKVTGAAPSPPSADEPGGRPRRRRLAAADARPVRRRA